MLQLARLVKQKQLDEANGNVAALLESQLIAQKRVIFYSTREKVSGTEQAQVGLTVATTLLDTVQGGLHTAIGALSAVPDMKPGMVGPFPTALTDVKIGTALVGALTAAANGLAMEASVLRGSATLAGMKAGFERRFDDWMLQLSLASGEVAQIGQQIAVAQIRVDIAQKELDNHDVQIDQANEVLDFLKSKFTSKDLYSFLVTQLSRTYQQVYKLAYDAAKTAERTLQFELGVEDGYLQASYVDSLHQGLLAGEKLIYDLKRMEVGYLERYKREYEIQKPISLAVLDGRALQALRETGTCDFVLPEVIFDLDFPGQYFRRIKAVRLTVPCVTGPHTTVSAKLTLLNSAFRKDAGTGMGYSYKGADDPRFVQNPVGIQSIATSSGQSDPGLFELNFRDERYLPFEGAGAISTWRLELPQAFPQFDYTTISDVVVQLSYTAREGGDALKGVVEQEIQAALADILELATSQNPTGLVRAFSLSREFPDVLHQLLTETGAVAMTLLPEHFPFVIRNKQMAMSMTAANIDVHIDLKPGSVGPTPASFTFSVNGNTVTGAVAQVITASVSKGSSTLLQGWSPEPVLLQQSGLSLDAVEDIVLVFHYTIPTNAQQGGGN
jgi:hypothetical protein